MREAPQDPRVLAEALAPTLDRIACGVVAHTPGGKIVYASARFEAWLGHATGELLGRSVTSLAPHEVRNLVPAAAGDERPRLALLRRTDTTTFPTLVIPHAGGVLVFVHLGDVETGKPLDLQSGSAVRATLGRIALELQSLCAGPDPTPAPVPLHHPDLSLLSPREMEVLSLLMAGVRVPAIADHLEISHHTVRNHLKSTYRKTGIAGQAELIRWVGSLSE